MAETKVYKGSKFAGKGLCGVSILRAGETMEHALLMDATVATGAAAMMAIRILLDHGVKQENILLTSLLMAETGIHTVAYAYPKVKLITTAVDKTLDKNFHIVPGMGNFGDRYFGTDKEELSN